MKNTHLTCLQDYDQYILEAAKFEGDLLDDVIYKYRFPNNYGVMLAYHSDSTDAKWSLDLVKYDNQDNNNETYIVDAEYKLEEIDIHNDDNLCKLFYELFNKPLYVRVDAQVKKALTIMKDLTTDQRQYVLENCDKDFDFIKIDDELKLDSIPKPEELSVNESAQEANSLINQEVIKLKNPVELAENGEIPSLQEENIEESKEVMISNTKNKPGEKVKDEVTSKDVLNKDIPGIHTNLQHLSYLSHLDEDATAKSGKDNISQYYYQKMSDFNENALDLGDRFDINIIADKMPAEEVEAIEAIQKARQEKGISIDTFKPSNNTYFNRNRTKSTNKRIKRK